MPSIRVLGNPIPIETKRKLGKALCSDIKNILKVPVAEVYFHEFDEYYADFSTFSIKTDNTDVTLITNGPARSQDVLQEYCAAITETFRRETEDPAVKVTSVYHEIGCDYIGTNGKIHSLRGKR